LLKELNLVRFNPWDIIECPFCGCRDFVTIHHAGVFCENCNAEFSVRATGQDYGVAIDVKGDSIYLPSIKNKDFLKYKQITRVVKPGNYDSGWMGFTENEVIYLTDGLPSKELDKLLP